jgi:hypothetical protein
MLFLRLVRREISGRTPGALDKPALDPVAAVHLNIITENRE